MLFALFATTVSPTFKDINEFLTKLKSPSGFFPLLAFPLAVIFEGLIHSKHKAVLVFWRIKNPLPGSRAFSDIAPKDPRINLDSIGALFPEGIPVDPQDQNSSWYKLYRQYMDKPIVRDAHRFFLLTRDLAALTIVVIPFCLIGHWFWDTAVSVIGYHALTLLALAVTISISSQNYGKRFVANVLVEATM
jgi:hypothetical protein